MPTEQVLIEFVTDDTSLQTVEERLLSLGKIDQKSAQIFKATNDQLKNREGITGKIVAATTKEQAIVDKLVLSLKDLSGESKKSVENLLKLSTDEISAGFDQAGISVDEYIAKLNKAGGNPAIFQPTNDQLKIRDALSGKLTLSMTKEQASVNKLVAALKNLTGESKASVQSLLKLPTEEIIKGFEDSGISVDQYIASLQKVSGATSGADKATQSLRTQLRDMIQELTRMKLAGEDNTETYQKLAAEAGNLKDSLADVQQEVTRVGSDTAAFDGLISGVSGLAGGFAVAQGAAALFGDESEEVQEVLLRVNAAMAILQGLQQIQNVLQKESAASLLVTNIQRKITNAQLVLETGLQSKSVVVRLAAAGAQRVLNAAMAANPIGIAIVALTTIIGLFALYANSAKKAAAEQAALNGAIREAGEGLDAEIEGIQRATKRRVSELEEAGAKQSDIQKEMIRQEVLINQTRVKQIEDIDRTIQQNRNSTDKEAVEKLQELRNERIKIENDISDSTIDITIKTNERLKTARAEDLQNAIETRKGLLDNILARGGKNTAKDFEAQKDLIRAEAAFEIQSAGENASKIFAIRAKLNKDLRAIDIEARDQRRKDTMAQLNLELLAAQEKSKAINERSSQTEIDIQKKIITETTRIEAEQEGLSAIQRIEIRKKGLIQISELQKEFNKQSVQETLEDFISVNNAQLQRLEITEEEKLNIRIDNIIAAASIEEEQNKGLSAKIKEINAKRDADIKTVRLQTIRETLDFELRSFETGFAAENREIERLLSGQDELRGVSNSRQQERLAQQLGIRKLSLQEESALIDKQTQHVLAGIEKEREALKKSFREKLISAKDYEQANADLADKSLQAVEAGEKKKIKLYKDTADAQKAANTEMLNALVDITGQIGNILLDVFQANLDQQQAKIDKQKKNINDLKEAGTISEKEAIERLKQIDREERKLKREQAVKDKEAAIFNATINTFQAVIKAYATTGPIAGPVLAAIAAAIGAAQIALIASRPIPQFAKGKKDSYEGLGEIGETGSELIESRGQMYVTKKPTIVWIGKADKIYNPKETKEIINRIMPTVNHQVVVNGKETRQVPIDYERLGKEIGKNTSMSLNIDGYREFIKKQQEFITYLDSRRGF